ncbi:hypothetical protein [Listeria welshimeri]|uniref:hypothetical protein n=1 Tax=Listeria welshimeri TaxID=1643 RepID=UPI0013A91ECB|nr:hypothetical protein [Listeria welshimeri]EDN7878497.1 hypothetical protein [Listeria monocytogenes]MBF2450295.1 hypothetical protein [Listeria welshimeri]MBF2507757.1 hypothetical protein [Listeria welshimeri]MBF2696333.1 hypothetical protein [Listeria welshimeri]
MRSGEFIFNDINFYENNVYIQERPEISRAYRNEAIIEIPGRYTPLTKWDGTYLPVEFTLSLFLKARKSETAIEEYYNMTSKLQDPVSHLARFYFDENYYYSVKFTEINLSYQTNYVAGVPFTVKATCSPLKKDLSGIYPTDVENGTKIYNINSSISQPLIEFTGSGNITINVNGAEFVFKNLLTGDYAIDSEVREVYQVIDGNFVSINNKYYSKNSFPLFDLEENIISWSGNVSEMKVTPKWASVI